MSLIAFVISVFAEMAFPQYELLEIVELSGSSITCRLSLDWEVAESSRLCGDVRKGSVGLGS